MNKGVVFILFFIAMVGMLASCKPGKKLARKNAKAEDSTVVIAGTTDTVMVAVKDSLPEEHEPPIFYDVDKEKLINELVQLWQKQVQYNTFKGKAKMHYEGMGQSQDFSANFRLLKDSIIWVNISAIGGIVNVARAYITPDSIRVINFLQKEAYCMPITDANKLLPASLDFKMLQNLIIGDIITRQGQPYNASDYDGTWTLEVSEPNMIQQVNYDKSDSTLQTLKLLSTGTESHMASVIQYSNYSVVDNRRFAGSRALNVNTDGQLHYLDMNFNNASFDVELTFPFTIPEKYTVNR